MTAPAPLTLAQRLRVGAASGMTVSFRISAGDALDLAQLLEATPDPDVLRARMDALEARAASFRATTLRLEAAEDRATRWALWCWGLYGSYALWSAVLTWMGVPA